MDEKSTNLVTAVPNKTLSTSQLAMAAARSVRQLSEDAEKRQKAGTRAQGDIKGKSSVLAAKRFGVSPRLVEMALEVVRFGDRDLLEGVERGAISVRLGAEIAKLQPRALLLLQKLLALRARAFDLDDDPDQWATDRLESLVEQASPSENWLREPDENTCPRCHGIPGSGCLHCFPVPTDPCRTPVKSSP